MRDRVFIGTNVLIRARDGGRRERAAAWLLALGSAGINLRILNAPANWTPRNEPRRSMDDIQDELVAPRVRGGKPITDDAVEIAWPIRRRLGYRRSDCLPPASAHHAGCAVFLTGDMAHGVTFEGLHLVNPFRASPGDVLQRN